MSAAPLYPVRPEVAASTLTDEATYKAMYQQSVINPDGFWREQAQRLDWIKPFTRSSRPRSTITMSTSSGSPTAL